MLSDFRSGAVEGIGNDIEQVTVTRLKDGLNGRCQVAAVVGHHRGPRADSRHPRRSISIGAKPVIKPPSAQLCPHVGQLRRAHRVGELGQHRAV